jgi:DNA topoisomerase-2
MCHAGGGGGELVNSPALCTYVCSIISGAHPTSRRIQPKIVCTATIKRKEMKSKEKQDVGRFQHADHVSSGLANLYKLFLQNACNYTEVAPIEISITPTHVTVRSTDGSTVPRVFTSELKTPETFLDRLSDCVSAACEDLANLDFNRECQPSVGTGPKSHIQHLHDAKYAGSSRAAECILLIALGNSPASAASAALDVLGRQFYGCCEVRGRFPNALNLSETQVLANAEVAAIRAALGVAPGKTCCLGPDKAMSISGLRYGRVVVLADGDCDGIHKTALLMNLIMTLWPFLLTARGFWSFLPPSKLPKCVSLGYSRGNRLSSLRGLGSLTVVEVHECFGSLASHTVNLAPCGEKDYDAIRCAFDRSPATSSQRKDWILDSFRAVSKRDHNPENIDPLAPGMMTCHHFIHHELRFGYSMRVCTRAIPDLIDGLKPAQRVVLSTCMKVLQLKEEY